MHGGRKRNVGGRQGGRWQGKKEGGDGALEGRGGGKGAREGAWERARFCNVMSHLQETAELWIFNLFRVNSDPAIYKRTKYCEWRCSLVYYIRSIFRK